jgi:ABC-type multidrug transport system fused ATPase/permease subunit
VLALINQVKEGIGAGREIRVLGRTDELINLMHKSRETYARAVSRKSFLQSLPRYYLEIVLVVAVLLMVASMVTSRGAIAAIPVLTLFAISAIRLLTSTSRILAAVQQIRIGLPALKTVYDDLIAPLETSVDFRRSGNAPRMDPRPKAQPGISLQGVSFQYDDGRQALSDIDISIPRGSSLGIVGASGSGKSTLVDVILGLITPQKGRVLIDGHDIKEVASEWRSRVGYVPQTIYLTDDTLKRNVALGIADKDIDDNALVRALHQASLTDFVASLPQRADTPVGELGAFLSGGQRQRIGIARALYHDPDALILDEASSALDMQTERAVLDAVNALSRQKTIIIVAHRTNTVSRCDRIIVLDDGRITESGTFEELKAAGTYLSHGLGSVRRTKTSKDDT